jgi:hypothetical protein
MASRRNNRQGQRDRKSALGVRPVLSVSAPARRALGTLASHKGATSERIALEVLRTDPPKWLLEVRPATHAEDTSGVDVVVTTDVGVIPLQIKSSRCGKREFLEAHPDCRYPVVIIRSDASMSQVRDILLSALGEYRAHVLKRA